MGEGRDFSLTIGCSMTSMKIVKSIKSHISNGRFMSPFSELGISVFF